MPSISNLFLSLSALPLAVISPVVVFTSPFIFTVPISLLSSLNSSASASNSIICLPKGSFNLRVPVKIPSSLGCFKISDVKSLMFTVFSLATRFALPLCSSGSVEMMISWLPCVKRTSLAFITDFLSVISPSLDRLHFLSFKINEEGAKLIFTPSVNVCTLAFSCASLMVLLALVDN